MSETKILRRWRPPTRAPSSAVLAGNRPRDAAIIVELIRRIRRRHCRRGGISPLGRATLADAASNAICTRFDESPTSDYLT